MKLGAAFFVAFGPVLTTCQTVAPIVAVGTPPPTLSPKAVSDSKNPWKPWENFFTNTPKHKCVDAPMMPTTFFAKRKFASFLNVIVFYDRMGKEFGFVESWFMDWKNPFGYAGASFYLKAPPAAPREGVWSMTPQRGENGWTAPTPAPAAPAGETKAEEEAEMWKKQKEYNREHGTSGGETEATTGAQQGFLQGIFGDDQNRISAYMTGVQDPKPMGSPFEDLMTVRDCSGNIKFQAANGEISEVKSGVDAQYTEKRTNTDNNLIVKDLGTPAIQLVRLTQKEPCVPFPPFCAQMGMWNWFIHGDEWEGHITQPGYNQTVGSGLITVKMTDGAATDMRFLALYSAYQFSNTRWSPLMFIVLNIMLLLCCGGCIRCCCSAAPSAAKQAEALAQEAREETEKLMKTVDAQEKAAEQPKNDGWMACCSRRGGRTIGPIS